MNVGTYLDIRLACKFDWLQILGRRRQLKQSEIKSWIDFHYRTSSHSFPILRKLNDGGGVEWEEKFEDLSEYTFTDAEIVNDRIFLLADPVFEVPDRRMLLIEVTLSGSEVRRVSIIAPQPNLLIVLGGEMRENCSQNGSASLLKIDQEGGSRLFWRDSDLFASNAQSLEQVPGGIAILVKRERPIGVRSIAAKEASPDSKRWGDDGINLWEFSLMKISNDANLLNRYDSSFGLSAFAQGMIIFRDKLVLFGSLGGRPALSEMARSGTE